MMTWNRMRLARVRLAGGATRTYHDSSHGEESLNKMLPYDSYDKQSKRTTNTVGDTRVLRLYHMPDRE